MTPYIIYTSFTRRILVYSYGASYDLRPGKLKEAKEMYERALAGYEKALVLGSYMHSLHHE